MPTDLELDAGGLRLRLADVQRLHPDGSAPHEANLLRADVEGEVAGFSFQLLRQELLLDELASLLAGFQGINQHLKGDARLRVLDRWIELDVHGDGSGWMTVQGRLTDTSTGSKAVLRFDGSFDQTYLPSLISQLEHLLELYPAVPSTRRT